MSDAPRVVEDAPRRKGRLRTFLASGSLDIQSKLLVMLLAVSIVAALVVGVVGYLNGRNSLEHAAFNQVTSLRESRITELKRSFGQFTQTVVAQTRNESVIGATKAFESGWDDLQSRPVSDDDHTKVESWYRDSFVPQLDARNGGTANPDQFAPTEDPQAYLQARYTAPFTDYDKAIDQDDAGDGSAWSKAHAEYQPYFQQAVESAGYEDLLLMDTDGDVVYSAYSGADLGTNLHDGPYRDSNLASGYEQALQLTSSDDFVVTDFARYVPSLNVPTLWVMSPVSEDGKVLGVMAVQVPIDLVNQVMTGDDEWKADGLGDTGESYLVGADHLMRSYPRQLIEHPAQYQRDVVAAGTAPSTAKRQVAVKGSVLLQEVNTTPVVRALQGKSGTVISTDYRGKEVLSAYAPLEVDGLRWVVVAQMDTAEAFAPVNDFARNIGLALVGIIVLVSLLSLLLAQVFVRPIRRLQTAVHRVSSGDLGVEVQTKAGDEIGDLGVAFNDMSRSLQVKQDLLDEQRRQNDTLLLTLMPEEVARRYKQGDETIAADHQDVAVVYADIIGFDEFAAGLTAEESLALVNDVWRSLDEAAGRHGIERVRTTRSGYLASCGLSVPRVDNVRRVVEWAEEAQGVLERFNAQHGAKIGLRAGIDTGQVTSGLVGRSSIVYDMWGDAVSLAYRVQGNAPAPGVYATQRVVDKLGDRAGVQDAGEVQTQAGPQRIWKLERSVGAAS
ncbi:adenylate/guanylate cyclase domain-containing protein [Curtobacterium pusillum]|uniref:HAMP domain-containing protein n=1 Tax=Curtobacterium pusillum TaxID=69373 RepID=A0ABX2MAL6_9MICO|nr:adenylate/guanylate cyclase domain-containing protein [Curtobacterium pusillum]NUU12379.1 HAMP domain-containing protein [Curtobacterium pusillum]GLK31257.1 adenylate/guanylate cyclase domain-containing protein [Curtobacterium pusillum]